MMQMNLLTKQKETHRLRERTYGCWGVGVGGRDREIGMDMYTILYLKWITNKDLLYSTGNLFNVMWQPGWERSLGEKGYMFIYG